MSLQVYIHCVTNRVFKILTIKERELCGQESFLQDYLKSLVIDLYGALQTFPNLGLNDNYIVVTNIVNYLSTHDVEYKALKREVFKALRLLNKIESKVGGEGV